MRAHLKVLAAYLVLALVFTYPLALNIGSAIPGDGFDGLQNYWNLWWVRRALLDLQTTPFFTRELFYPTGTSLLFHTLNIFNGLWSLPIQLLTNLAITYNSVVLFTFVLSGYGTYLLARYVVRLVPSPVYGGGIGWGAFLGGFIFAFAPFRFAHLLGHMQVLSTEWLPFFALSFLQMRDARAPLRRRAIPPALFLTLNALCDWYYVLYLLIFAAIVVLCDVARRRALQSIVSLAAVLVLFVVFVSPLLVPMLREGASAAYLRPPFEETVLLSADLLAFITPSEFHPWWSEAARQVADHFTSSTSERTVFAGFVPLALAALGVWRWRRAAALWLGTLAAFFVLALGPSLHVLGAVVAPVLLPYAWLYALVPLVRITRSVSRFDVMVMLALAVLAALGLAALRDRPKLVALCAALIAIEFLAIPYPLTPIAVPSFYATLGAEPDEFVLLELPINWDRPDPLLYQTVHAHPLITAYTSRSNPLSIVERTPILNRLRTLAPDIIQYDTRAIAPSVLSDLGVRYVVNHPLTMGAGDERAVTNEVLRQLFGSQPPLVNEPNLVVYRVPAPNPYQPYLVLGEGWGEVRIVDGKPQRTIAREARLLVRAHDDKTRILNMRVHTQLAPAKVTVWQPVSSNLIHLYAETSALTNDSTDMLVRGDTWMFITVSEPIEVDQLELREP